MSRLQTHLCTFESLSSVRSVVVSVVVVAFGSCGGVGRGPRTRTPAMASARLLDVVAIVEDDDVDGSKGKAVYFHRGGIEAKDVGGKLFIQASLANQKVRRAFPQSKQLWQEIRTLRTEAFWSFIEPPAAGDTPSVEDDVVEQFDTPPKQKQWRHRGPQRRAVTRVPECVKITLPPIDDVPGADVNVTCTKPGSALWIELTSEMVAYVRAAGPLFQQKAALTEIAKCSKVVDTGVYEWTSKGSENGFFVVYKRPHVETPDDDNRKKLSNVCRKYFASKRHGGYEEARVQALEFKKRCDEDASMTQQQDEAEDEEADEVMPELCAQEGDEVQGDLDDI